VTLKPPVSANDHAFGTRDARATLVEYGDYQCPHCAAAEPIVRAVQRSLGSDPLFVFRNFPMSELHPAAEAAAELAEAAAAHGKFWDAHHAIFAWSRKYGPETFGRDMFAAIAEGIGIDQKGALDAIAEQRHLERIRADFESGVRSGVNGTPTFFVNGLRYDGDPDTDSLVLALVGER